MVTRDPLPVSLLRTPTTRLDLAPPASLSFPCRGARCALAPPARSRAESASAATSATNSFVRMYLCICELDFRGIATVPGKGLRAGPLCNSAARLSSKQILRDLRPARESSNLYRLHASRALDRFENGAAHPFGHPALGREAPQAFADLRRQRVAEQLYAGQARLVVAVRPDGIQQRPHLAAADTERE